MNSIISNKRKIWKSSLILGIILVLAIHTVYAKNNTPYELDWELVEKGLAMNSANIIIKSLGELMEIKKANKEVLKLEKLMEEKKLSEKDYKKFVFLIFRNFLAAKALLTKEQEQKFSQTLDTYLDTDFKDYIKFKDGFAEECKKFLSPEQINIINNPPQTIDLNTTLQ